ncbi:MAG: endonuclease/exonuclease/phosphatase family protein [Polyangiales bacterium]
MATWNCFGVPSGLYGVLFGEPHLPKRFRIPQIARALAAYDVICVQESFLDSVAAFFAELAEDLGMHLWHDRMLPHVVQRSTFGGGLAILAREPLDVTFEMFATRGCGFDAWACKGYATCELKTPSGKAFRLVNLHLQSDDPKLAPHVYLPSREAQLDHLLAGLRRIAPPLPTLLCGDLNVPEGSDEYHQVLAPRMHAHGYVDVASGLGLHTYAPAKNSLLARLEPDAADARFDYILTRDAADRSFRVVAPPQLFLTEALGEPHEGPLFASDHFGIGVELQLE